MRQFTCLLPGQLRLSPLILKCCSVTLEPRVVVRVLWATLDGNERVRGCIYAFGSEPRLLQALSPALLGKSLLPRSGLDVVKLRHGSVFVSATESKEHLPARAPPAGCCTRRRFLDAHTSVAFVFVCFASNPASKSNMQGTRDFLRA